jgi:hypothetical protein
MRKTTSYVRVQRFPSLLTANPVSASNVKREDENLGVDMDKYMAILSNSKGKRPSVDRKGKPASTAEGDSSTAPASALSRRPSVGKKVSFANEPEINLIPPRESNLPTFSMPTRAANIHPTEHMIIIDDDGKAIGSEPLEVVDTSKLAQEARENMNGIGAIVASMTVDSMTDDDDDDYDIDDDSDELDEVDWRTLDRAPVGADLENDSYKSYIEGLMKKHDAAFENVGPRHDESILESLASSASAAALGDSNIITPVSNGEQDTSATGQKGVRFAEELDIQIAPALAMHTSAMLQASSTPFSENIIERAAPQKPLVNSIVERTGSSQTPATAPSQPKKVSRFKAARSGG